LDEHTLGAERELLGLNHPSNMTTVTECVVGRTVDRLILFNGSLRID